MVNCQYGSSPPPDLTSEPSASQPLAVQPQTLQEPAPQQSTPQQSTPQQTAPQQTVPQEPVLQPSASQSPATAPATPIVPVGRHPTPLVNDVRAEIFRLVSIEPNRFHPKDIEQLRVDPWWAERFVLVYSNYKESVKHLVDTFEWRKAIGVHRFNKSNFPEHIKKSGQYLT